VRDNARGAIPARWCRPAAALLLLGTALVAGVGCRTFPPPDPARLAAADAALGQLLLVGFAGSEGEGNADLDRLLCESRVGGALVFGRNIVSAEQLARLTGWMHARARACTGRPLLVAVDAEGGRVMRLSPGAGYAATLSHEELGEGNDLTVTELEARRMGAMLREAGIDWNLAPVVDVGDNPANPVIVGTGRSFGADPQRVTAHARAFIRGMHAAGLLTALKHFPGHGSSIADSHLGFVDVTDTANPDRELVPYRVLVRETLADSIMTAHVFNRRLDWRHPATLSRPTIQRLLRDDVGFEGVVLSDDLRMGAIEQHYGLAAAVRLGLAAGVDVLVIADDRLPDGRSAATVALGAMRAALARGRLSLERVESALRRVSALKARRAAPS
jgi:beta-N-acetylhexosaminidase